MLRAFSTLAGAEAAARLLSFAFYLAAARALSPDAFGDVRLVIAVALLMFGPLQVLVNALVRELGRAAADAERQAKVLLSGIRQAMSVLVVLLLVAGALPVIGVGGETSVFALAVVFAGYSIFQLYFAITRGLGLSARAAAVYVIGSALQLVVFAAFWGLDLASPDVALFTFGVTAALPVLVVEIVSPVIPRRAAVGGETIRLAALGALGVAQIGYVLWNTQDQIIVDVAQSSTDAGVYAAGKNLAQIFAVLPSAISGFFLPRIAAAYADGRRGYTVRLTVRVSVLATAGSMLVALVASVLGETALAILYGDEYRAAAGPFAALAVSMSLYVALITVCSAAIAWDRPQVFMWSICVAAATQLLLLLAFADGGPLVAGWCVAASTVLGLLVVTGYAWRWRTTLRSVWRSND